MHLSMIFLKHFSQILLMAGSMLIGRYAFGRLGSFPGFLSSITLAAFHSCSTLSPGKAGLCPFWSPQVGLEEPHESALLSPYPWPSPAIRPIRHYDASPVGVLPGASLIKARALQISPRGQRDVPSSPHHPSRVSQLWSGGVTLYILLTDTPDLSCLLFREDLDLLF